MHCCYAHSNILVTLIYIPFQILVALFLGLKTMRIKDKTIGRIQTYLFFTDNEANSNMRKL